MITTQHPEVGEYAASFGDYVARIADDEDILAALVTQPWITPMPTGGSVYGIKGSYLFKSLHSHLRFQALLRKMTLA